MRRLIAFLRVCLLPGVLLAFGGCSTVQEFRVTPQRVPAPFVARIPLAVGVYYPPALRSARPMMRIDAGGVVFERYFLIGEASVATLDAAMRGLFERVVEIRQWPPGKIQPDVAGILAPHFDGIHVETNVYGICTGAYLMRYRIEVYSPTGERLTGWAFKGQSCEGPELNLSGRDETFFAEAMRFAAADLIASFFRRPEARKWLRDNGVAPEEPR